MAVYVITGIILDKCRFRVTDGNYPTAEAAQQAIDEMWECPVNNPRTLLSLFGKREDMAPRQGKKWSAGFIETPEDVALFNEYIKKIGCE